MDLFHREALIRMLEILIASIISFSPPLIPPPPHPSVRLSVRPSAAKLFENQTETKDEADGETKGTRGWMAC